MQLDDMWDVSMSHQDFRAIRKILRAFDDVKFNLRKPVSKDFADFQGKLISSGTEYSMYDASILRK